MVPHPWLLMIPTKVCDMSINNSFLLAFFQTSKKLHLSILLCRFRNLGATLTLSTHHQIRVKVTRRPAPRCTVLAPTVDVRSTSAAPHVPGRGGAARVAWRRLHTDTHTRRTEDRAGPGLAQRWVVLTRSRERWMVASPGEQRAASAV